MFVWCLVFVVRLWLVVYVFCSVCDRLMVHLFMTLAVGWSLWYFVCIVLLALSVIWVLDLFVDVLIAVVICEFAVFGWLLFAVIMVVEWCYFLMRGCLVFDVFVGLMGGCELLAGGVLLVYCGCVVAFICGWFGF